MNDTNFVVIFLSALIPLAVGFVWYNPKIFGTTWMNACGLTEEKLQGGNMALIFGLSFLFGIFIAFSLMPIVIHPFAIASALGGYSMTEESAVVYNEVLTHIGGAHRSFGHGALHGGMTGILFILPIIAINAMFERKDFKYIAVNVGYWIVTLALMGGVICQFV